VRPKKDKFYLAKINKGQKSRKKAKNYKFGLKKAKLATLHTATVLGGEGRQPIALPQ